MSELATDHHKGSVREVVVLAWPIVVSMLSYTAMGVADTLFVGWVGKTEVGAVGLSITAFFLVNGFFLGALNGVKVVSAQATGAGDHKKAESSAWQGVILSIPCGLFVITLGLLHESIFDFLGGTAAVRSLAGDYFVVRVYSGIFWYVTWAICNAMQGMGNTRTPMHINVFANLLNVALDPIFIFGWGPIPAMGVTGAAIATVIACAAGMVLSLVFYIRAKGFHPRWDWSVARPVINLGLPIGIRFFFEIGGWTAFTALLARMGENELAANQIAINIIKVSFMPGYAISDAACIMTGNYFGAGDMEGVKKSFHGALKVAIVFMAVCGLFFWIV
ncbi:MAG: MATE family efflux transporter, partial [Planctomycetota bacterium]